MNTTLPAFATILPVLLGGVGLFLLGMILMSEGLKAAAGGALQRILERSTGTPLAAFLSGLGLTAAVQSSSATTIATIGFVSAGLLSFPAAVGVIIGANVGTTSTGWIVSLLGFKLNVAEFALPLVGLGALLRLLTAGRRANLGMALAGFGLIFIGIDFLQEGMAGLALRLDLSVFSTASLADQLGLVLAGTVMTVLLQSSSAAVALTLTALHSGAIGLTQAAYLVIGQNLGTTVTALLASAGASIPARRTALAHILFNAVTGMLAFGMTPQLLTSVKWLAQALDNTDPSMAIALFHTVFNLLGATLFLPFVGQFAHGIIRLIPNRGPAFTRHLDRSLLLTPSVAVAATARALGEVAVAMLDEAVRLLDNAELSRPSRERLWAAQAAIREARAFLAQVRLEQHHADEYNRRLALLHASDHLDRLVEACLERKGPLCGAEVVMAGNWLAAVVAEAGTWLRQVHSREEAADRGNEDLVHRLAEASARQAEERRLHRAWLLAETAAGRVSPDETQARLEDMRWVDRVGYHTWRALHHLVGPGSAAQTQVYEEAEK